MVDVLWQKVFDNPEVFLIQVPFRNVVTTETNVYVIRSANEVLIVDLGAPTEAAAQALLCALDEIGVDLAHASIFFTHMHYDHAGLACELPLCGNAVYLNEHELRASEPSFAKEISEYVTDRFQREGMSSSQAAEVGAPIEITTPISACVDHVEIMRDGDVFSVGSYVFEVVDLPGHTRGMQGLYQPNTGLFFAGDQLLFLITPSIGLFLDGSDSFAAYERSMSKLLSFDITHLYHSHGAIRRDFRDRAEAILKARHHRCDEVVGIIEDANASGYQPTGIEVIERIGWRIPFPRIADCDIRQQWLIYTQGVALLDHLTFAQRICRTSESALVGNAFMTNRYSLPRLVDNTYLS